MKPKAPYRLRAKPYTLPHLARRCVLSNIKAIYDVTISSKQSQMISVLRFVGSL